MTIKHARQPGAGIFTMDAFTAHDSNAMPSDPDGNPPQALYCGTGGDVALVDGNGNAVTLNNLAGGVWHRIVFQRVKATGTTAGQLVAGFI